MSAASPSALGDASGAPLATPGAVIAIPVRNEAERIAACLRAIDAQVGLPPGSLGVVLFLNNCTDGTEAIVADFVPHMSVPVRVTRVDYAGAHAGWARREAMNRAADWLGADGMILSTDADSRVPPDWVARNWAALDRDADAVAGRIELDAAERALLPPSLHWRGEREDIYSDLLTEAEARIDPDPHDPWPCHRTTIGATLAVSVAAYRAVGGMPAIALGEDGAFVALLLAQGLHVRHDPAILVTVSGRLVGRAPGGVADTIRARCEKPDSLCDARLESVPRALHRYIWRRR
ncbi:MAG: glycosyl transferase, partial [Methylobacterium sp.]|nr:glycosyl transferase [Methylobacterium sp.]